MRGRGLTILEWLFGLMSVVAPLTNGFRGLMPWPQLLAGLAFAPFYFLSGIGTIVLVGRVKRFVTQRGGVPLVYATRAERIGGLFGAVLAGAFVSLSLLVGYPGGWFLGALAILWGTFVGAGVERVRQAMPGKPSRASAA